MGRKSKLTRKLINKARELSEKGLSNKQIFEALQISCDCFYRYMKENDEFRTAVEVGREITTDNVENALMKRALGYDVEESQVVSHVDKDGNIAISEIKKSKRHIPPETAAMAFWLKNRRPNKWKDRHDLETHGNVVIKLNQVESNL